MGFFDPPYKKILAKSPPEFATLMQRFDPEIADALSAAGVPANGFDMSRNLIYSIVIPRLSSVYGVFSAEVLQYAQMTGENAYKLYPKQFIPTINQIVHVMLTLIERETGEKLTPDNET